MENKFSYWVCRFVGEKTFRLYGFAKYSVPSGKDCFFYWKGNDLNEGRRKMKEANISRAKGGFLF